MEGGGSEVEGDKWRKKGGGGGGRRERWREEEWR